LSGGASDRERNFERIFTCKSGLLPMKYLEIPINKKKIEEF
jgi:hypothetical protein